MLPGMSSNCSNLSSNSSGAHYATNMPPKHLKICTQTATANGGSDPMLQMFRSTHNPKAMIINIPGFPREVFGDLN